METVIVCSLVIHKILRLWKGRILDEPMEIQKEILIYRCEMRVQLLERLAVVFFDF